jgi:hypothetical protein
MLREDGILFIATLFSWRYHPVPEDYYRFTPAGLEILFEDIACLETNFNSYFRRHDMRGFWNSKRDAVPLDSLGGWRENWKVYYFGKKRQSIKSSVIIGEFYQGGGGHRHNFILVHYGYLHHLLKIILVFN